MHLRAAVEQLYAVPPAGFTPLRAQLAAEAKKAGDGDLAKQITGLRKPTVAAWAVNHFVRDHGDELAEFRAFAELLREAQRTLDADQLRALGRERARRVDAVAERVAQASVEQGQPVGATVAQEIRETLTSLIADEAAEQSVLTGALVRALSYSGFGSVEIGDVVALDDLRAGDDDQGRPALEVLPGGGETVDLDERRRARRDAERGRLVSALDHARTDLRAADRQVAVLTARQEEVTEGIADLERRLAAARERLAKVGAELDEAQVAHDTREAAEAAAQRALDEHDAGD